MPSVRERELARVINQSWKPLERWAMSPAAKQALAGGLSPFTGTQKPLEMETWLKALHGVNDPLKEETRLSMKAQSADIRGVGANLSFDVLDEVSERYAETQAGLLVKALQDGQKQVIQKVISRAVTGEITVDTAARHLKGSIGLHPAWAQAVAKYGDRQFERLLQDGMKMDLAADKAAIQQERYRKRLVSSRAKNIARTEIATANNVGQYAAYGQAVEDGYAHPQSLKEWAPGPGACGICGPMSGEKVQWDQPFSNGNMMPPGHPGCRCSTNLLDPTQEYRGIDHTNPQGDRLTPENMATMKPSAIPQPKPRVNNDLSDDMKLPPGVTMPNYQRALYDAGYDTERYHLVQYDGLPRTLRADEMPVKQGAPLSMKEASQNVNPNWGSLDNSRNCTMCTTSYEFRRRGFDVQAGSGIGRPDDSYISSWWADREGNPARMTRHMGKNDFKSWMKEQPPGARGAVAVNWKGGGGHVWNWEVDEKGTLHYIETQTNGKQVHTMDYAEWSKAVQPSSIRTVRLDDKVPNQYTLEAMTDVQPYSTGQETAAQLEQIRRYNAGMGKTESEWAKRARENGRKKTSRIG